MYSNCIFWHPGLNNLTFSLFSIVFATNYVCGIFFFSGLSHDFETSNLGERSTLTSRIEVRSIEIFEERKKRKIGTPDKGHGCDI